MTEQEKSDVKEKEISLGVNEELPEDAHNDEPEPEDMSETDPTETAFDVEKEDSVMYEELEIRVAGMERELNEIKNAIKSLRDFETEIRHNFGLR